MSAPTWRVGAAADPAVATVATTLLGCGAVVGLTGAAAAMPVLAIAGGAALGIGLAALLAADWLDGLVILALALPAPALYSTDAVRISAAAALTALVVFAWLLRRGPDPRAIETGALPMGPTLLFAGAVAVSAAFAPSPLPALRESVNIALMLALLVVAANRFAAEPRRAESVAAAIVVVAAICGGLAALEAVGVLPGRFPRAGTPFNRAALGFGWPNELAMFFALALPFSVHTRTMARGRVRRALATAGVGACVLGLAATFSRGSWLAAAAATAVLFLVGERRMLLRVWILGLMAVLALDVASGGALRSRIANTMVDQVVAQRLALQLTGLLMFRAHPVFGVGPGGFEENLDRFGPQIGWLWDYVGSAHNLYVHVAAETGAVGLAALLAFFGSVFAVLLRGARRARDNPGTPVEEVSLRRALLWSFTTACLAGMVEWPFAHGTGQLIMLVAAMGCGLGLPPAGERPAR